MFAKKGSGIFVSPKGVLQATESIGLCLVIWFACGVVSLLGALCYAELGTLVTESGAELIYILRGFGTLNREVSRVLAFLYSWSAAVILKPTSFAAICLACANYILGPIIGQCGPPGLLVKLGALVVMCKLMISNSFFFY
jgi:L-type amino acid transporter 9